MTDLIAEEQPNHTLARGILILEAFNAEHPEWGIRELSRELRFNAATTYRLVSTLCNAGYLEQNPHTRRYSLGPSIMKLSRLYASKNPLPTIAMKVFESFADRFEYNFYLATLSLRFDVIYLVVLDGRGPIKVAVEPGSTIRPHSTALGKLLLAYREDEVIQRFLDKYSLEAFTPRTITTKERFWNEIARIRQLQYAVNNGEHYDAVGAVAVPVPDEAGEVKMSVSLGYPRQLVVDDRLRVELLVSLAREVSEQLTLRLYGSSPKVISSS